MLALELYGLFVPVLLQLWGISEAADCPGGSRNRNRVCPAPTPPGRTYELAEEHHGPIADVPPVILPTYEVAFHDKFSPLTCCHDYFIREYGARATGTVEYSECVVPGGTLYTSFCKYDDPDRFITAPRAVHCYCPESWVCEELEGGSTSTSDMLHSHPTTQCVDRRRAKFSRPVTVTKSVTETEERVTMLVQKQRADVSPSVLQEVEVSCREENPVTHALYNGGQTAGRRRKNTVELIDVTNSRTTGGGKFLVNDQGTGFGCWTRFVLDAVPHLLECRVAGNFAASLVMSVSYFDVRRKIHPETEGLSSEPRSGLLPGGEKN